MLEQGQIISILESAGYTLRYIDETESDYTFRLYIDNGQGYGTFDIPVCPNCIDEVDVLLWIKEQFHEKYPELFTKGK